MMESMGPLMATARRLRSRDRSYRARRQSNPPHERNCSLDPLIEAFWQQRRLSAIGTFNEALHELPPANRQANHSRSLVFTQPGSKADLKRRMFDVRSSPSSGHSSVTL